MDLGERIFQDFNRAFESLPVVEEVGTIFVEEDINKTPICIEEKCIGLKKWSLKVLFVYAYKELMKTGTYDTQSDVNKTLQLSRCVVLLCSDCTTAWNKRKAILDTTSKEIMMSELHLTALCLRRHPKSTEAFAHRRWAFAELHNKHNKCSLNGITVSWKQTCPECLKPEIRILGTLSTPKIPMDNFAKEMSVCTTIANSHASNYVAWSHRSWVICNYVLPQIFSAQPSKQIEEEPSVTFLLDELRGSRLWIDLNVSDHSGIFYHQQVLKYVTIASLAQNKLLCSCNHIRTQPEYHCKLSLKEVGKHWTESVEHCHDLIRLHGPAHEALWMYKYGLLLAFGNLLRTAVTDGPLQNYFTQESCVAFCEEIKTDFPSAASGCPLSKHCTLICKHFKGLT